LFIAEEKQLFSVMLFPEVETEQLVVMNEAPSRVGDVKVIAEGKTKTT